tara:strand:- start:304 stop:474 length:171 start_codon:yes stop_codon:yes gene_type:complete
MNTITGTTIEDLHNDLNNIIEVSQTGDETKTTQLINLFNKRLMTELLIDDAEAIVE